VAEGSKLFGAAILRKSDLGVVHADTNQEGDKVGGSLLWHGETWCIKQFFEIPRDRRPDVKDCLFLTTHEPCSLCLSAITWGGFDNFCYMFTYEDTDKLFDINGDLDIFAHVFHLKEDERAQQASKDGTQKQVRPEYKLQNKYFVALSFAELGAAIDDPAEKDKWASEVEEVKRSYGKLSKEYRKNTGAS
jgi:tRNA(Arg) A34 adenosine deaminase TadA